MGFMYLLGVKIGTDGKPVVLFILCLTNDSLPIRPLYSEIYFASPSKNSKLEYLLNINHLSLLQKIYFSDY